MDTRSPEQIEKIKARLPAELNVTDGSNVLSHELKARNAGWPTDRPHVCLAFVLISALDLWSARLSYVRGPECTLVEQQRLVDIFSKRGFHHSDQELLEHARVSVQW